MTDAPLPPQDLEAERCVLGCVLVQPTSLDEIRVTLRPEHFYAHAHRTIFEAAGRMYDAGRKGIDAITLASELGLLGKLDDVGGAAYLQRILETVPHAAHAAYYAKIVRGAFLRRLIIETGAELAREAHASYDAPEEILARAEQKLFGVLTEEASVSSYAVREIMEGTFNRIFERIAKEGEQSGLPSGFGSLDKITSGFHPTELVILAARPSMGKTALVCNFALAIAEATWKQSRPETFEAGGHAPNGAFVVSLEQGRHELNERLMVIRSRIDGHRLRQGTLGEMEQHSVMEASNELRQMPIFIDDSPQQSMTTIAAKARQLRRRYQIGIVIIDYLQLIEPDDRRLPREQQISGITRRLKFLAKELEIPVVALAQLNRGVEQREDKRPRLADLRESGAIEQDADCVLLLHRPDAYDPEDRPGEADLIVAKNRSGPIGTAELVWIKHALRFGDKAEFPRVFEPF